MSRDWWLCECDVDWVRVRSTCTTCQVSLLAKEVRIFAIIHEYLIIINWWFILHVMIGISNSIHTLILLIQKYVSDLMWSIVVIIIIWDSRRDKTHLDFRKSYCDYLCWEYSSDSPGLVIQIYTKMHPIEKSQAANSVSSQEILCAHLLGLVCCEYTHIFYFSSSSFFFLRPCYFVFWGKTS